MDTDSFVYNIKTYDLYKDMMDPSMIEEFDFSSYPTDAIQFADVDNFQSKRLKNRKVMGKFKDELGNYIMDENCFLLSKTYSYTIQIPVSSKPLNGTQLYKLIRNPTIGDTYIYI